jgi:hypothetical protein
LKYLKIIRKIISKLNDNKKMKKQLNCNYKIVFEFTSWIIQKIRVNTYFNSDDPIIIIIFSIPKDFDFNFVDEMLIPKKVFKKLIKYYLKKYLFISLLDCQRYTDNEDIYKQIEDALFQTEKSLVDLFTKYSEIIERDQFNEIFLYEKPV